MGYTINEDGTVTRDNFPQNNNNGENSNTTRNNSNGGNNNRGCIIWITLFFVAVIVYIIFIGSIVNPNTNPEPERTIDTISALNCNYAVDSVDSNHSYNSSYLSVSPSSVTFPSEGGRRILSVNSSDAWWISTNTYEWGHLTKGEDKLILRIDANESTEPRNDYFEISSASKTYRVNIRQSGMEQTYLNINPTNISFYASGGSQTIYIDTNSDWSISVTTDSWGHLTKNGNQLTLRVDPNNLNHQRTDYFKIKAGNLEKTINITQRGIPNASYSSNKATGNINNIWIDHNVMDSYGNYGMRIHVKFDIKGMLNRTGQMAAYFYNSNGTALKDTNGSYCTEDGNVATHVNFTPNYDNCTFNDLVIFMPYSEFHLSRTTSCYFTISIWDNNSEITQSGENSFQLIY